MANILPTLFVGHGNPMNALLDNNYTRAWHHLGQEIPTPKTVLVISAHWYISETAVTISNPQRTIHDFGGFPKELYNVEYPASGDPVLARRVQELLAPINVSLNTSWGLDHGTWSVLCHVYPKANIPIIQLSIDETKPAAFHFEIGQKLAKLREEGILIIGSGNLVHNLHTYAWGKHMPDPYDWAARFENFAKATMVAEDYQSLINYEAIGKDAMLSIPTPEHYLPLLYVLGTRMPGETITFPIEGIDGGSISMLAVKIG